jgi:hypothetical protein
VKFGNRGPLNIQRTEGGEKIFRQTQQKSARVVNPTRRFFVKYDGKDSVDTLYDEFLEVPNVLLYHTLGGLSTAFGKILGWGEENEGQEGGGTRGSAPVPRLRNFLKEVP